MRRRTTTLMAVIVIALTALALHTLVYAQGRDGAPLLPRTFISPIDPPSVISGTVFDDADGDGEQGEGEPGIPGATVKFHNTISGTITTDPDGNYRFNPTWSGTYTVTSVTPAGYAGTTPQEVIVRITGPGQHVMVDFGYRGIGAIRGTVFDDRNLNGVQNEGEPGVSDVTIALLQEGSVISTTNTAGDGSYEFVSLFLGDYTVEEINTPGYADTTPNTRAVTLTTPGQEETVNFGDYGPSRVTGVVFNDLDGDGVQDDEERGIPGVTVDLLRDATVELTATTDINGVYFLLWDELDDYTVRETNLEGYVSISPDEVAISKTGASQVAVVNFADRGIGTIHGTVFEDSNGDGAQDVGESGIEGVTVTLFQDHAVELTTATAGDGSYEFVALGLGDYTVQEIDLEGYNSTTPNVLTTTLTITRQVAAVDFGDRGIGAIWGIVFDDLNENGVQDVGEPSIDDVTITLLQNSEIVSTTTTSGGAYAFDPVWLGDYTVRETDPEGYKSTTPNEVPVSLTTINQIETRNFGDRGVGTIQGMVFDDDNGNGVRDGGESGIEGVTVTLLQGSSVVSTTSTAGDGTYAFASLDLGAYVVRETDPEGYDSTTPNAINVLIDEAGEEKLANFGDRGVGTIQGTVFDDQDHDGTQDVDEPGIGGVTVTLLRDGSVEETATTDGDGVYAFTSLWLGDYIVRETDPEGYTSTTPNEVSISLTEPGQEETVNFGDRGVGTIEGVVFDDQNGDGAQDVDEPGIDGVTVTLLQGGSTVSTTVTAGDGSYQFASLDLDDYAVEETDLEGYVSTTPNQLDVSITGAGQEKTANFGDRGIGAIGGIVFDDQNGDGTQDVDEPGIDGVSITLLQSGSTISTTTTAGDGSYEFAPLFLGDYTVEETDPEDYGSTTPNEVDISLTVPGREERVIFGDRRVFIFLPIIAMN